MNSKKEKKHTVSAERLAEAMAEAGLKAQDIVNRTGITKASMSHYLSGYYCPTSSKAEKMAEVLGVSPVWLMGFDVPKVDYMVRDKNGNSYIIETMEPHDKVYDLSADYRRLSPESQKRLLAYMKKLLELDEMEGGDQK